MMQPLNEATDKHYQLLVTQKKLREKSRECHNHKPQPFPDPKRKRKPTNLNKHKLNKRMKSTKISSLFPKQGSLPPNKSKLLTVLVRENAVNRSPAKPGYTLPLQTV